MEKEQDITNNIKKRILDIEILACNLNKCEKTSERLSISVLLGLEIISFCLDVSNLLDFIKNKIIIPKTSKQDVKLLLSKNPRYENG